jgi:hypothetical protein
MQTPNPVDTSIRGLLRGQAQVLFQLLGHGPPPPRLRWEDTALNLPELRADHVLVIGTEAEPEQGALYVEYQLVPDPSNLVTWAVKWGGLLRQLGMPTALLVLYLERGRYATFPDRLTVSVAGIPTELRFTAVRLWEHADRIRSGELWQLAPLLVLCEDNPTEATMRQEVELITHSAAAPAEQADLLAYALRVGARDFSRTVLERIFREMLPMVRGATIIDDWIAEGEARGEARGRETTAREVALELLRERFGELPDAIVRRVEALGVTECKTLTKRLLTNVALEQLFPN